MCKWAAVSSHVKWIIVTWMDIPTTKWNNAYQTHDIIPGLLLLVIAIIVQKSYLK